MSYGGSGLGQLTDALQSPNHKRQRLIPMRQENVNPFDARVKWWLAGDQETGTC